MKKFALVAAVATFGLMSCKKDYTCTCTSASLGSGSAKYNYTKVKKKTAEDACASQQATFVAGGYSDAKCSI